MWKGLPRRSLLRRSFRSGPRCKRARASGECERQRAGRVGCRRLSLETAGWNRAEPIDTPQQQLAVVDHYRGRWMIEEYFKALKSGCSVEKRQLEDYESLVNLLATLAPIAYQMLLIRSEARRAPDDEGTKVLPPEQLQVLRVMGRLKLSEKPTKPRDLLRCRSTRWTHQIQR